MKKLHVMNAVEGLGWSLVGIFIPIYLLGLGYSLRQVFAYYLIQNTVIALAFFGAMFLMQKTGIKKIFVLRFPLLLSFLAILYYLPSLRFPVYLLAVIDGCQAAMYWTPLHILFSRFVDKDEIGASTGKLFAIPQLATMVSPLIGGLIVASFGFKALFLISIILFAADLIPLLYMTIPRIAFDFEPGEGMALFKKYKKYFYSEIANNIGEEVEGIIWPIFVYLSLVSVVSVGLVGTLLAASTSLFTLFIGRLADRKEKVRMIKTGAIFIMAVWALRYIFGGAAAFYILTVSSGMAFVVFSIPYYSLFYSMAKKEKSAVFFAFREIPVNLARLIVFGLGILCAPNLKLLFPLAGAVYIFFLFWQKPKAGILRSAFDR